MIEIKYGAKLLNLVIDDGMTFRSAIDEIFPDERKSFSSSNISISLCFYALKHYFLFENIVHSLNLELSNNKKAQLFAVLANNFYKKSIQVNAANSYLKTFLSDKDFEKLLPILKFKESPEKLITFEKNTDFYYATKYNVPIWIVHMWRRQYGDELVTEFLDSSMKIGFQAYSVNTLKTTTEELMKKYPDFSSPFENEIVCQTLKRYFNTPEYKNDEYFLLRIGIKCLLEEVVDPNEEILLYSGFNDSVIKELIVDSRLTQSLNVAVPNLDKRAEVMRFIRKNNIRNVNLFEANDIFQLKSGVFHKVDKVILYPDSSHFDLNSTFPDFLFHFDRSNLDEIIQREKDNLELCSNAVDDGGQLVYIVDTLNKKESTLLIAEFLEKHPEFELEREEQLLPSHPFSTLFYYAILLKREKDD